MVRTRDELVDSLSAYIGEDNSDAALAIMEDVVDTIDDLSGGEDWRARYEELDRSWRERYRERFRNTGDVLPTGEDPADETHEETKEEKEIVTYEDFYKSIEE